MGDALGGRDGEGDEGDAAGGRDGEEGEEPIISSSPLFSPHPPTSRVANTITNFTANTLLVFISMSATITAAANPATTMSTTATNDYYF